MPDVESAGLRIHYEVRGAGEPLVLIHGYTASGKTNWEMSGWFDALAPKYRLIVPDLRGHGRSEKPHSADAYSLELLTQDVLACMDEEGVQRARVMGYSMGGMVTLNLLLNHPERVSAAVVGGMGMRWPRRGDRRERGRQDEPGAEPAPPAQPRRGGRFLLAYARHYDPIAMRAAWVGVFRGSGTPVDISRLGEIQAPVLAVSGMRDALYPGVKEMVPRIAGAKLVALSGRGHIGTVRDPRFKQAVLDFFATGTG
jgi:pimeloyl-ACP methyl ester carboxylesterase